MTLNPFFLQGSTSEQGLVQDLINEHLRMYGIEVYYIPRRIKTIASVIREVTQSSFENAYPLEAYVNTYEGYTGAGDIMTKFGMSLRDEVNLIISKERFEDSIAPFLNSIDPEEIIVAGRPKEGDLIFFPLGQRLFEIKFVEHEKPFYQLGKNYVYELTCELFEYEDEVIDTGLSAIDDLDSQVKEEGYISTLKLISIGSTATATAFLNNREIIPTISGYVRQIFLNNDGTGYTSTPSVGFTTSPVSGGTASAVAITTSIGGIKSIKEILITNAGYGYTVPPMIKISGGGGIGAAATCSIETVQNGVCSIVVTDPGSGYATVPTVTISNPTGVGGSTATAVAFLSNNNTVSSIKIRNPGVGYVSGELPSIVISNPNIFVGVGTYQFNETVTGSQSGTTAIVKSWDAASNKLKISISNGEFMPGELIIGSSSSASYALSSVDRTNPYDKYSQNDEIEKEADAIVDFTESNPFGTY